MKYQVRSSDDFLFYFVVDCLLLGRALPGREWASKSISACSGLSSVMKLIANSDILYPQHSKKGHYELNWITWTILVREAAELFQFGVEGGACSLEMGGVWFALRLESAGWGAHFKIVSSLPEASNPIRDSEEQGVS